jgi:hypothetical protein
MEVSGSYSRDYYPEIYVVCALTGIIIIALISAIIYGTIKHRKSYGPVMLINILLSSGLMSGFLCIFYFTYLDTVEKQLFRDTITKGITDSIYGLPIAIRKYIAIGAQALIAQQQRQGQGQEQGQGQPLTSPDIMLDQETELINTTIKHKAYLIFGILFGAIIIVSFAICYKFFYTEIAKIFGINTVLLLSIMLIEIMFATFFIKNYIILDTNNITYAGLAVYQWGNSNNPAFSPVGSYLYPFFDN